MFAAIDIGYYGEVPAREHTKILEAIGGRDALLARKLMYDHIVGSKDKVLQLASGTSSPASAGASAGSDRQHPRPGI